MSSLLFEIIKTKVYKDVEIQSVTKGTEGSTTEWIFDFKSQSLSKVFLQQFAEIFWSSPDFTLFAKIQVGGMESGAIPLVAAVSLYLPENKEINVFYIRKSRKKSDLANLVEGEIKSQQPIILVDDILNSGSSIRKQVKIIEEQGGTVTGIFVCLRYRDYSYYQDLIDKGIKIVSIFELNDFKNVLPVKNLESAKAHLNYNSYFAEYKVSLTSQPNLHLVVPKSAPLLVGDYIYMGTDDGYMYSICKNDGSIKWKFKISFAPKGKGILSSPQVYKDKLLFGAYDGNLYCLNRLTGQVEWVFYDADWIGSTPYIDQGNGVLYVGLEFGLFKKYGGVVAINILTGKSLWKSYDLPAFVHASPAYSKRYSIVVCGCNDGYLYAFDSGTGKMLWKFKTEGEIKYGACFEESKGLVIFGSFDGGVYVLNVKDGSVYAKFSAEFGFYSTPLITGNKVIIGSLDKKVYCFNLDSKKTDWMFQTGGRIFSSPVAYNESVFIGNNEGKVYELDINEGKLVSYIQITERIVNAVQVESKNGKIILYVPSHIGELYKFIKK